MKLILLIAFTILSLVTVGCSTCTTTINHDSGTGTISVSVNQGRKGLDSLMDGVQANVPLQGGTVSNPTNTTTQADK